MKNIIIVGSVNADMAVKSAILPLPRETSLGGTFFMNAGGKGANQAVAAPRLGGNLRGISDLGYNSRRDVTRSSNTMMGLL